jgi:hypothetical protein
MQGTEIKQGNVTKVMPDFIKIYDPKDEDTANITPGVVSYKDAGNQGGSGGDGDATAH